MADKNSRALGEMEEIKTINRVPLCDTTARTEIDKTNKEVEKRSMIGHLHDDRYAKLNHDHEKYLLKADLPSGHSHVNLDLLNTITKSKLTNWDNAVDNMHAHTNMDVLNGITSDKIHTWDNKSDFSGNYNDLSNKPVIPSINGLATEAYVDNLVKDLATKAELNDLHAVLLNIILALQAQVDKLEDEVNKLKNPVITHCLVSYNLATNITLNKKPSTVVKGGNITWTISVGNGYELDSSTCIITMDGKNITSSVLTNNKTSGTINIPNVTGNIVITLKVKNTLVPCTSISLYSTSIILYEKGATSKNLVSVKPANTTDTVKWSSSNTNVATVDQTGKITAVAKGSCTVTATCGSKSASCSVLVEIGPAITINKTAITLDTPQEGDTIKYSFTGSRMNHNLVTYSVSNNSILSHNRYDSEVFISAKNEGSATIKFYYDGEYQTECKITVKYTTVKCTKIEFTVHSISLSAYSGTHDMKKYLVLTPGNTTDPVTWYTDNNNISVSSKGIVTANGPGSAKIQARCNNMAATILVVIV